MTTTLPTKKPLEFTKCLTFLSVYVISREYAAIELPRTCIDPAYKQTHDQKRDMSYSKLFRQ